MRTLILLLTVSSCAFAQNLTSVSCTPNGQSTCSAGTNNYTPTGDYSCQCDGCCVDGSNPSANYRVWWNMYPPPAGGMGGVSGGGSGGTAVKVSGHLLLFCTNWVPPIVKGGTGYDIQFCLNMIHQTIPIVLDCNTK